MPGSLRLLTSVGDERNALPTLTVKMAAGRAAAPCARLYLIDEKDKIKAEQVFYVTPE